MLEILKRHDFQLWQEAVTGQNELVYVWANSKAVLGVGRTSAVKDNNRVNPGLSIKNIVSDKDSGKKFIAAFISKQTKEVMRLYAKPDTSLKISNIASELEIITKNELTQGKFLVLNDNAYSKKDFNAQIILPEIQRQFGIDSIEDIVASLCAKDGDLWARMKGHNKTKDAMYNIINSLLYTTGE